MIWLWRRVRRRIRQAWGRFLYGDQVMDVDTFKDFDPIEIWSLDHTICCFVTPRLKRLREISNGHPGDVTFEEWLEILDKMIYAFETYATNPNYVNPERQDPGIAEGLDFFRKYFFHLWD